MLLIDDDAAALDFDYAAANRLLFHDAEQQVKQLEAMTGKQATTSPLNRKHVGTITPANFRDQNW